MNFGKDSYERRVGNLHARLYFVSRDRGLKRKQITEEMRTAKINTNMKAKIRGIPGIKDSLPCG